MAVEDGRVAAEDLAGVFEQMLRREVSTSRAGSAFELEHTNQRRMSLTATFLTLKPMLMPGVASWRASWCISVDLTSVVRPVDANVTTSLGLSAPVSTRPTGTVPMPPILNTSWRGRRSGLLDGMDRGPLG